MEFDGAWCLDSADSGFEKMEAGLNARAIDFAKLGQLFLDDGRLNGERLITADWVELASGTNRAGRAPTDWNDSYYDDAPTEWEEAYYAFMWWGFERDDGPPDFSAIGDHGQFVYVSTVNDVVIVRNGVEWGLDFDEWTRTLYRAAEAIGDS